MSSNGHSLGPWKLGSSSVMPPKISRASSDHHIAGEVRKVAKQSTIEKKKLLPVKSETVTYIQSGNHIHHRVLPRTLTSSNIVFPCASSISLTLLKYSSNHVDARFREDPRFRSIQQQQKRKKHKKKFVATQTDSDFSGSYREDYLIEPEKRWRNEILRERLRINVSGQCFETHLEIFERHPDTLLGNREKRKQFFDKSKNELFFDRHRPSFEAIFCYYQYGGRLKRPIHVPDDVFLAEILFYQLEHGAVEEYKKSEGYTSTEIQLPSNSFMRKVWMLFEYPETSRSAFAIALVSVAITLISIVLFCIETLPTFATTHCVNDEAPNFFDPFFIIETFCTVWFTFEALIRFLVSPSKLEFWKDFKNIVDVMAILPYYVTLFNVLSTMSCEGAKSSASLAFLRVIRLVRIFKLTKHSVGLQVLILTFKASLEGLGLFLVALCVCLLVFSSAIYYAELGTPSSQIHSIPDAFWWAIITMTTVGYGDKVPVGYLGKIVGAACAITGVLTLAIPVPIITGHFNRFYAHKTGRGRHV